MKRFLMCVALIALLPGLSRVGSAYAESGKKQAAVAPKAGAQDTADFVGSDVCATCHAEVAKKFSSNPHSKLALEHGGQGATCESCHGSGKAHVEGGGDVTKIKQLAKLSPKEVDATCLGCHAGAHPNFDRSPHAKGGVSCTGCHSIHAGDTEAKLLKAPQPKLCFQCHADVKPAFDMPFHHKVNEGLVKCTDCHDAHGTFNANNVKSTADQNAICTKCHA
jgi:DmsE family decaheme c-type cytochrome